MTDAPPLAASATAVDASPAIPNAIAKQTALADLFVLSKLRTLRTPAVSLTGVELWLAPLACGVS
jgi:hypothetical protein